MYRTPWRSLLVMSILIMAAGIGTTVWGITVSVPVETLVLSALSVVLGALLVRMSLFGIRRGRPPTVTGWVALGVAAFSLIWMVVLRIR